MIGAPLVRHFATMRSIAAEASDGPSASTTTAASTSGPSAASPQRSEAPGPRSQSGQSIAPSSGYAPATTTISSSPRTCSSTAGRSSRCFGAPNRVAAPAARTTAAITCERTMRIRKADAHRAKFPEGAASRPGSSALLDADRLDHDRLRGRPVAGAESLDRAHGLHPLRDRADDRVVRREPCVRCGYDEELAPGASRRLGARLRHRDDALRVPRVAGRWVDGRIAGAARPGAGRVAALDHEARNDAVEGRVVVEAGLGKRDERRRRLRRERRVERDREVAAARPDHELVRGAGVEWVGRRLLAAVLL